ncbi:MAG: type II toxin-antitoxin system VapC family toxin [Limisphaerales bacterium]
MILPDINLLVYAHNEASRFHAPALRWWLDLMRGDRPVGLGWASLMGFVRLVTHPGIQSSPLKVEEALAITDTWFLRPNVQLLQPGSRHYQIFGSLLREAGTAGNLVTDAHLAALAIEHQAELHSNDADFARFPGLRWVNPIAPG